MYAYSWVQAVRFMFSSGCMRNLEGIYKTALQSLTSISLFGKIVHTLSWAMFNLSTCGVALEPSSDVIELILSLCIFIVLIGIGLVGFVVGIIKILSDAHWKKNKNIQKRCHDMERWMNESELPESFKDMIRKKEQERLTAVGGDVVLLEMLEELPEDLRKDLQRCLGYKIE